MGDPGIEGGVDHRRGLLLVEGAPEVVATQANNRDLEIPDPRGPHQMSPMGRKKRSALD